MWYDVCVMCGGMECVCEAMYTVCVWCVDDVWGMMCVCGMCVVCVVWSVCVICIMCVWYVYDMCV